MLQLKVGLLGSLNYLHHITRNMELEQIIPALALIAVLILVLPGFIKTNNQKSVFFKNMKLRRIYDAKAKTLIYLSYSTKETSGSYKHSLSTVPLWETLAFKKPA